MRRRLRGGVVTLTNIKTVHDRKGKPRHYLQVKGQKLIRLPDAPMDSPDFLAAWAAAMKRAKGVAPRPGKGTIAALCTSFLLSRDFRDNSTSYQSILRRHCMAIEGRAGGAYAKDLMPRHITADMAPLTASVALARLKTWRALCKHGLASGALLSDPTATIKRPEQAKNGGHEAWTRDEVATFRARWPIGTTQRAIFEVLHWTGARISDAVRLGPGMVRKEGVLVFRQQKTGEPANVPWTCTLPGYVEAADRDMMLAAIAHLSGQMTFLATRHDRTRSGKSIGGDVSAAAKLAGVKKTAHGLRKTRATALAEGGATASQIAAWTGHKTLAEVEHYTREYDRMKAVMG